MQLECQLVCEPTIRTFLLSMMLSFVAQVAVLAYFLSFTVPFSRFVKASVTQSPQALRAATVCNGSPSLCNRSFGNVTFVGTHDSYAVGVNNRTSLTPLTLWPRLKLSQWLQIRITTVRNGPGHGKITHIKSVTRQLKDGVRMLQVQTHNLAGVIQLCHTSCVRGQRHPLRHAHFHSVSLQWRSLFHVFDHR